MIGTSLRFALAIGLHLRNDDPFASPNKKESLVRIWWSLHSIESLLCALIGRPCIIPNDECTVPLPQVIPEEQSEHSVPSQLIGQIHRRRKSIALLRASSSDTSSRGDSDAVTSASFLGARVAIDLIMQKALSKLYSPRTSADSWERIQGNIASLISELDEWAVAAQLAGLSPANSIQESRGQRERLLLSFHYYSVKLLICRPCLCRPERRIKDQSNTSAYFNQNTAEACIQAAQAITRLFPDEPDIAFIYQQGPWWCIVHNMMQAIAVFLLEIAFGETYMVHNGGQLYEDINKLVRWLKSISISNAVAERAYKVVIDIIRAGAPRMRIDISDVLAVEEAGIDHGHSSQAYSTSSNTTSSPHPKNSFPQSESGMAPFSDPSITANFGTQFPTTLEEQPPAHAFEESKPDQFFMLDADLKIPSVFCNPFTTSLDQSNLLHTLFLLDRDATIDDT